MSAPAELVRRLFVLLKAASVYGPENEGYRTRSREAREALAGLLAGSGAVRLEAREDRLFFNGAPIPVPPGEADALFLCGELRRGGAGGLEFRHGAEGQLDAFAFAFKPRAARRTRSLEETAGTLRNAGVSLITALPPPDGEAAAGVPAGPAEVFHRAVETVEHLMSRARAGEEPDLSEAKAAAENLARQVAADPQAMLELAILERFDEYTYAHSVNVSVYSLAIGCRLGLRPALLAELGFGALFHDLGKASLPRELIDKPGELDENDWRLMRRHPLLGAEALLALRRPLDSSLARAISIAFEHHLAFDGSGYPRLQPPRRQELFSRICALADAFDAMTSGRVYAKRAMSPDEALRRMAQGAGTAFDPFLFRVFIGAVGVSRSAPWWLRMAA
ncbi:MAG: HD domain-containing protein [Elusimicrobiota bacterium]|nr:HD domain-containing protein [Elusimicrobiota bacterium]